MGKHRQLIRLRCFYNDNNENIRPSTTNAATGIKTDCGAGKVEEATDARTREKKQVYSDTTISPDEPADPKNLDYWIDTSTTPNTLKQFSATSGMLDKLRLFARKAPSPQGLVQAGWAKWAKLG